MAVESPAGMLQCCSVGRGREGLRVCMCVFSVDMSLDASGREGGEGVRILQGGRGVCHTPSLQWWKRDPL